MLSDGHNLAPTIGSDSRIALWNSDDAEGAASSPRIMFAPELWPATVTLEAVPPKLGMTFWMNFSERMVS